MSLHRVPRILGIACILLLSVSAQNPVHIQYSRGVTQLLTSSTLTWIPHTYYYSAKIPRDIVIGGFEITEHIVLTSDNDTAKRITSESPIYVCRVQHEGTWVAGGQRQGEHHCTVGFLGKIRNYDKYDLLENVDSASRLSWTTWNRFTIPPNGMVAVREERLYVARHSNARIPSDKNEVRYTSHCIGSLTLDEGLGQIECAQDTRMQKTFEDGEILVETEPQRYELTRVKLNNNKRRVIKSDPRILGEASITNTGNTVAKLAEAFPYSYSYWMYWGQLRSMSKGLDTSITLLNGTSFRNIKWGTEDRGNETILHTVNVVLEPGTGVNVTLKGNYSEMEVFYTGDLVSHYADGTTKTRSINGFRREETMADVHVEYSPVFFLGNLSIVPTTEPPPPTTTTEPATVSSTTPQPTTTAATTKRAPQPPILMSGVDEKVPKDQEVDENMIVSPKKTDLRQGADGGPLSLEDRADASRSASGSPATPLSLLLVGLAILSRLT